MKKMVYSLLIFFSLAMYAQSPALSKVKFHKRSITTIQGTVEYIDLDSMTIRIDGRDYRLSDTIRVSEENDKEIPITKVKEGSFVIAAIKDNLLIQDILVVNKSLE